MAFDFNTKWGPAELPISHFEANDLMLHMLCYFPFRHAAPVNDGKEALNNCHLFEDIFRAQI